MLPRELGIAHSSRVVSHGCAKSFSENYWNVVVDGTGRVVLEVRRLQKTDISSVSATRNERTTAQAGGKISFLLPQESRSRKLLPLPDV
ncbi:hypothetical protein TNCV_1384271 [Trichonephila clavipes]|nr:hypothetical protein TNCV_1384271 [Trichonephila clavipes]